MLLIFFLLLGGFFIISNENIKLDNAENVNYFLNEYADWFDSLITNGKAVTGHLVKMEWLPNEGKVES